MNMNPWQVENMASYERDRIRDEVRQIRLEQKAMKARVRAPRLVLQVWGLLFHKAASEEGAASAPAVSLRTDPGKRGA